MPSILVTGGAGYIGSHTVLELLNQCAQYQQVIAIDNFVNAVPSGDPDTMPASLQRIEEISGGKASSSIVFYKIDLTVPDSCDFIFQLHPDIDCVIHFAALKAVGESCHQPLRYYDNNLSGTINLLKSMQNRRAGDLPQLYCDCAKANQMLQWKAELSLEEMCRDLWNLQQKNPYGFKKRIAKNSAVKILL